MTKAYKRSTTSPSMSWAIRQLPFWDRVAQLTEINGEECHIFTGHKNEDGYGRVHKDKKLVFLHREVYKKHHGEFDESLCVMHTCDVPACINIKHLKLGTHADNMADRSEKGRFSRQWGNTHTKGKSINRGEKHGLSIFTENQVREIKLALIGYALLSRSERGAKLKELANMFSASVRSIDNIRAGRRWSHVRVDD